MKGKGVSIDLSRDAGAAGLRPTLFGGVYVGEQVALGTSADRYQGYLLEGEAVRMEFLGRRDALVFTDLRMIVIDPKGIRGRKVALSSVPWRSISAFSIQNAGALDRDAELTICGLGEMCVVQFSRKVDLVEVNTFVAAQVLAQGREC